MLIPKETTHFTCNDEEDESKRRGENEKKRKYCIR